MHKLAAKAASNAKPQTKTYKLSDGGGLYLLVKPNGTKAWRFNYRFNGKQKTLAIGVFPDVSLKAAREKHKEARERLANDIDPSSQKKAMKAAKQSESANNFEVVAREWARTRGKKAVSTEKRQQALLEKDLFPYLGNRPIADINTPEVLLILRKIETRGAIETAHRAKRLLGQVFRYAIVTGRAERDPAPPHNCYLGQENVHSPREGVLGGYRQHL